MKKVMLVIRDGWGYREEKQDNRIAEANTPNTDKLMQNYPNTIINASGEAVGLPDGFQGNSEVGHMTISAGRIFFQAMTRIDKAIEDGSFYKMPQFLKAIENAKKNKASLHLMGIIQTEGVHGHINHLLALLDICNQQDFKDVKIHIFTDGRDAPVHDSLKHLKTLQNKLSEIGFGEIVSVAGRFYSMDRDKRWERIEKAYRAIVEGETEEKFESVEKYIKDSHGKDITDEFMVPAIKEDYEGFEENDSVIYFNFRTDRPREMTQAIVDSDFEGFHREKKKVFFVAMTHYYDGMKAEEAFGDMPASNFLGEIVSKQGWKQLRISETEKYAHVTFFFNGKIEDPFPEEERKLIPSPKVETYDEKPEMSVYEIKDGILEALDEDYQLIVTNLVNGDMVGHTGDKEATIKGLEAVDDCLGQIVEKALSKDFTILIFADHGNAEDQTDQWRTSHTINPVPLIVVSNDEEIKKAKLPEDKGLQDIAPTVLKIMGLTKPKEMTGESLI